MPLFKIIINVLSHYAIFSTYISVKKKIFIGLAFIVMLAIGIPVYLATRSGKLKEVQRDYIVIKGIGTKWKHEIVVPKGTSINYAVYLLNLKSNEHIEHIYTKSGIKKIPAARKDLLIYDTTIQVD